MPWIDWTIVGVVALSVALSLWRGFVREAIALAGWVLAFFAARLFHAELSILFTDAIQPEGLRLSLAWLTLFIAVLFLSYLVAMLAGSLIDKVGLTIPDRLLGMAFGLLRGLALCAVLVLVCKAFTRFPEESWWAESRFVPHLETVADWFLAAWRDEGVADAVHSSVER